MDIQYAILGLLNWKPFSGYDLKKIITDSDLFYWSGTNNQIYYSLVELHNQGLVDLTVELQQSLPARKIYSITEQGQARLREMSLHDPEPQEFRNNFLIQLAWTDQLSDDEMDDLLGKYELEVEVRIKMHVEQMNRTHNTPERTGREKLIWYRIYENILETYQNELTWTRSLRAELKCNRDT
jgi:PadR family transcriptional regulator, regulatory protein AphA